MFHEQYKKQLLRSYPFNVIGSYVATNILSIADDMIKAEKQKQRQNLYYCLQTIIKIKQEFIFCGPGYKSKPKLLTTKLFVITHKYKTKKHLFEKIRRYITICICEDNHKKHVPKYKMLETENNFKDNNYYLSKLKAIVSKHSYSCNDGIFHKAGNSLNLILFVSKMVELYKIKIN